MRLPFAAGLFAGALFGCLGARAPDGLVTLTSPPAESDAAARAPLAPLALCVDARTRADIEKCSPSTTVRREDVGAALAEMDAEFVATPPPMASPADAGAVRKRSWVDRNKPFFLRTPRPKQLDALDTMDAYRCANPSDLDVTYRLAQLRFELHDWDAAALLFLRVAEGPAEDDRSVQAVMLFLDALNVLGSNFDRANCFDDMIAAVPEAISRLCSPELVARHPARTTSCARLGRIESDIHRLEMSQPVRRHG